MKFFSFSILFLILVLSGYQYQIITKTINVNETIIDISIGDSSTSIANKLYKHNIITSPFWFKIISKYQGFDKNLSYGKFLFSGEISINDALKQLHTGKVVLRKVTIPEGLTIRKTVRILSNKGFGNYDKFVKICNDSVFAKKVTGYNIPSLEGFLYPETYNFPYEVSEEYVIKHIVRHFFREIADYNFSDCNYLSFKDVINLASIVEREARVEYEKPIIASVYLNRLEINQKLQADPTIAYSLELRNQTRKKIYFKDLKIDSPYNTYKYSGLPPTPICSPSKSSIKAVLNPEETNYFFFVADGTGKHIFSQTYSQHLSTISTIRNRRKM